MSEMKLVAKKEKEGKKFTKYVIVPSQRTKLEEVKEVKAADKGNMFGSIEIRTDAFDKLPATLIFTCEIPEGKAKSSKKEKVAVKPKKKVVEEIEDTKPKKKKKKKVVEEEIVKKKVAAKETKPKKKDKDAVTKPKKKLKIKTKKEDLEEAPLYPIE
jgi:hypothetical protein